MVTEISGVAVFGQIGAPDRRRPRADKAEIYEPPSVYPILRTAAGLSRPGRCKPRAVAGATGVTSPRVVPFDRDL